MKVNRFVTEYATYVKRLYMAASIPDGVKRDHCDHIDFCVDAFKSGLTSDYEAMQLLSASNRWIKENS